MGRVELVLRLEESVLHGTIHHGCHAISQRCACDPAPVKAAAKLQAHLNGRGQCAAILTSHEFIDMLNNITHRREPRAPVSDLRRLKHPPGLLSLSFDCGCHLYTPMMRLSTSKARTNNGLSGNPRLSEEWDLEPHRLWAAEDLPAENFIPQDTSQLHLSVADAGSRQ